MNLLQSLYTSPVRHTTILIASKESHIISPGCGYGNGTPRTVRALQARVSSQLLFGGDQFLLII